MRDTFLIFGSPMIGDGDTAVVVDSRISNADQDDVVRALRQLLLP